MASRVASWKQRIHVTGFHDGFVTDIGSCRYDPTRDITVLCASDGGINLSSACVTRWEANVVNKIWYGPTADGSAPSPAVETGYAVSPRPGQPHFGYPREVILAGSLFATADSFLGEPLPISLGTSFAAIVSEDPALASPSSWIPPERAKDGWKALGFADLAKLRTRAEELDAKWDSFDAANPDLTRYLARNGKIIDGSWGQRIQYFASDAKDRLGLRAVLVRPDGFVARASDTAPSPAEVERAAARWVACS